MSQGVYVLGGKCPRGKCPRGKCLGSICPWGKYPEGTCPVGLCPRTKPKITMLPIKEKWSCRYMNLWVFTHVVGLYPIK